MERGRKPNREEEEVNCVGVSAVGIASGALEVGGRTWAWILNETEGRHTCTF